MLKYTYTITPKDIYGVDSPLIPPGYEEMAFRPPKDGEECLHPNGSVVSKASGLVRLPRFILKRVPWPQRGDTVWFMGTGGEVWSEEWVGTDPDLSRRTFGNVFKTMEDAQAAVDRVRTTLAEYHLGGGRSWN